MSTTAKTSAAASNGTRFLWIGPVAGLACMAALLIAGLITGSAGMTVMAASTAALLAAVWSSTVAAAKKKAARAVMA